MNILANKNQQIYQEQGVVVLRQVFSDWIETLRAGVEYNATHPGTYQRIYTKDGQPGQFWGDYCNWQNIQEYRSFVFDSPAAAIAADLMNSKTAAIFP